MTIKRTPTATVEAILSMLSDLMAGHFRQTIEIHDDPALKAIVKKLNETAQFLESQAKDHNDATFIIDALGIGIWKWDVLTDALEWDRNMYQLYGVQAQDFNGAYDAWENSLSATTKTKTIEEINAAIRGERDFDTTFQVVHKTGKIQEIRTRAFVIRDEKGKALKMWGINIDRSREAELEQAMKYEQEFSAAVLNSVTAEIAVINREGVIISVNESWRRFSMENSLEPGKYAPNTDIGANYLAVFQPSKETLGSHNEEGMACRENIEAVMKGNIPSFTMEYPCHSPEQRRWFSMTVTPMKMNQGGAVISHTDITARKISEQKVIQSSKLASLGEMSAGIAHEINNPLTTISLSLNVLPLSVNNPKKFEVIVENLKKACARISKIVNGLKKFSRSGEGTDYKNHSLSEIVKETLVLTETKSKLNNTPVICHINSEAFIQCNEISIEQVLINLINNSIDAVNESNEKWVKIEVFDEACDVILRVIDSGTGIPIKFRNKLFEPFFTTKKAGEGTGLGLSITKKILDEHNATITVLPNTPNTCFEIRFKKVMDRAS